ncbi:hypothetical protein OPAG_06748 [Rhodococcus opacus PD630]|nr:hypothetical protein OPAG_06748 [Rhodococcus opacus PD630]
MGAFRYLMFALATAGLTAAAGVAATGTASAAPGERPGPRIQLTEEQRACLSDQGLIRSGNRAENSDERADKRTPEQIAKREAAFAACGIPVLSR